MGKKMIFDPSQKRETPATRETLEKENWLRTYESILKDGFPHLNL